MLLRDPTGPHIPSMFAVMVCTAVAHGSEWAKARVLVDSGSEHPLLISQSMADKLELTGPILEEDTQVDGAFWPLWDVGNVDMVFNNKVVSQKFLSSPLSHYDVILGEPWLRDNKIIMDYAHKVLWQWNNALLLPVTFGSQHREDLFTPDPEAQAPDLQYKRNERAVMMSKVIATGMRHATMSPADHQSKMAYIDDAKSCEKAVLTASFERRLFGMDDYELSEDAKLDHLVDMDIPIVRGCKTRPPSGHGHPRSRGTG